MSARQCADPIEAAMTTRDLDGLQAVYADDVVFNSPVTAVQFRGKSEVAELMTHVLSRLRDLAADLRAGRRAPMRVRSAQTHRRAPSATSARARLLDMGPRQYTDHHQRAKSWPAGSRDPLRARRSHARSTGGPIPLASDIRTR
jgi:hypothetical protein